MSSIIGRLIGLSLQTELLIMNFAGLTANLLSWAYFDWRRQVDRIRNLPDKIKDFHYTTLLFWTVITQNLVTIFELIAYGLNLYPILTWSRPNFLLPWLYLRAFKIIFLKITLIMFVVYLWLTHVLPLYLFIEFLIVEMLSFFPTVYNWISMYSFYQHVHEVTILRNRKQMASQRTSKISEIFKSDVNEVSVQSSSKSSTDQKLQRYTSISNIYELFYQPLVNLDAKLKTRTKSMLTVLTVETQDFYDDKDEEASFSNNSNLTPAQKLMKDLSLTQEDIDIARARQFADIVPPNSFSSRDFKQMPLSKPNSVDSLRSCSCDSSSESSLEKKNEEVACSIKESTPSEYFNPDTITDDKSMSNKESVEKGGLCCGLLKLIKGSSKKVNNIPQIYDDHVIENTVEVSENFQSLFGATETDDRNSLLPKDNVKDDKTITADQHLKQNLVFKGKPEVNFRSSIFDFLMYELGNENQFLPKKPNDKHFGKYNNNLKERRDNKLKKTYAKPDCISQTSNLRFFGYSNKQFYRYLMDYRNEFLSKYIKNMKISRDSNFDNKGQADKLRKNLMQFFLNKTSQDAQMNVYNTCRKTYNKMYMNYWKNSNGLKKCHEKFKQNLTLDGLKIMELEDTRENKELLTKSVEVYSKVKKDVRMSETTIREMDFVTNSELKSETDINVSAKNHNPLNGSAKDVCIETGQGVSETVWTGSPASKMITHVGFEKVNRTETQSVSDKENKINEQNRRINNKQSRDTKSKELASLKAYNKITLLEDKREMESKKTHASDQQNFYFFTRASNHVTNTKMNLVSLTERQKSGDITFSRNEATTVMSLNNFKTSFRTKISGTTDEDNDNFQEFIKHESNEKIKYGTFLEKNMITYNKNLICENYTNLRIQIPDKVDFIKTKLNVKEQRVEKMFNREQYFDSKIIRQNKSTILKQQDKDSYNVRMLLNESKHSLKTSFPIPSVNSVDIANSRSVDDKSLNEMSTIYSEENNFSQVPSRTISSEYMINQFQNLLEMFKLASRGFEMKARQEDDRMIKHKLRKMIKLTQFSYLEYLFEVNQSMIDKTRNKVTSNLDSSSLDIIQQVQDSYRDFEPTLQEYSSDFVGKKEIVTKFHDFENDDSMSTTSVENNVGKLITENWYNQDNLTNLRDFQESSITGISSKQCLYVTNVNSDIKISEKKTSAEISSVFDERKLLLMENLENGVNGAEVSKTNVGNNSSYTNAELDGDYTDSFDSCFTISNNSKHVNSVGNLSLFEEFSGDVLQ